MFWTIMESLFSDCIIPLGNMMFNVIDTVGGVGCIVAFTIVGLFISFIVLHKSDALSLGSDLVSAHNKAQSDKARRDTIAHARKNYKERYDW